MSQTSFTHTSLEFQKIHAREVLDSRGYPTVEAEVTMNDPHHPGESVVGRAIVPSGASTGDGEALELRDSDKTRFLGKGVRKAVAHVNQEIAKALVGVRGLSQRELDQKLIALDGTDNKSKLGANAILAVSMAALRARSLALRTSTATLIAQEFDSTGVTLPVPLMNIINGGKHADNGLALQEFMIVPAGFDRFSEALRAGAEVFHHLKKILHEQGLSTGVGDEGGFAPVFPGEKPHEQAIQVILKAIEKAGYKAGEQIFLALDAAASEFSPESGKYQFEGRLINSSEMRLVYRGWLDRYPIVSIEDGLAEHDWGGWKAFTDEVGARCQLVGDDLLCTNAKTLAQAIDKKVGNAILIKLNQIGTVTETLDTMALARKAGYRAVTSHRSGESEDTFIADLAVGTDCGQIKTGSASRTDRIAKYNQLLRLEEMLGSRAKFLGRAAFAR